MRRLPLAAVTAALTMLSMSAAAQAAPFTVGPGGNPDLETDAAGTAYLAWTLPAVGVNSDVAFCKVPRGATACPTVQTLSGVPASQIGRPAVLVNGATVTVVSHRCCFTGPDQTYAFVSSDGGASFGAPILIGTGSTDGGAVLGPDGAVYAVDDIDTFGVGFERMAVAPAAAPLLAPHRFTGGYDAEGTIAFAGATPIVAFDRSAGGGLGFSAWSGTGDVDDLATWSAPAAIGPGDEPQLAGGPGGTVLLSRTSAVSGGMVARRWTGSGFGAPVTISADNGYVADLDEDASGRLSAVWRANGSPATLRYATSGDGGATWTPAVDALQEDGIFDTQVSVAPDGKGWAAWDKVGTNGQVRLAPLEDTVTNPNVTHDTTVREGTDVITLSSTKGCIPAHGGVIVVRLSTRSKKRKGKVVVKVREADFGVDGTVLKQDRKAPFAQRLTITGLASGSKHKVFAKAFLKAKRMQGERRRTITATFLVC